MLVGEFGLKDSFEKIQNILKDYMDLPKEDYSLISLWIMGTYLHKQFSSYPYLFFNAMKGSGKSRILNIIKNLSKDGTMAGSMTEAVLFRTGGTLCLDEFEGVNAKGQENLKLILNSAYKKGLSVYRMAKKKIEGREEQVPEKFDVYRPITMANIWGLDNVLQDRCIPVILEKSNRNEITKLIEDFEGNMDFQVVRGGLRRLTEKINNDLGIFNDVFKKWNAYQKNKVNVVNKINKVNIVNKVSNKGNFDDIDDIDDYQDIFLKIDGSNLSGRDLEIFFPIFIIADIVGGEVLNEVLETAKQKVSERKESDREESKDVMLYEFLAQSSYSGYVDISLVVKDLQEFYGEEKWINSRGISRALKRLKLKLGTRSTGKNKQVKIDIEKAKQKLCLFKETTPLDQFTDKEIEQAGYTKEELQDILK